MISKDEYSKTTELMSQAIDAFSEQISVIRAGRANPFVLKNIYVVITDRRHRYFR